MENIDISGRVAFEAVDQGSKSERTAVVLKTETQGDYVLRRKGAPSFGDHSFDDLVGCVISAHGIALGNTLIVSDYKVED